MTLLHSAFDLQFVVTQRHLYILASRRHLLLLEFIALLPIFFIPVLILALSDLLLVFFFVLFFFMFIMMRIKYAMFHSYTQNV